MLVGIVVICVAAHNDYCQLDEDGDKEKLEEDEKLHRFTAFLN